ncbi:MAG: hypothetical protein WD065_05300 [Planctomycetaceae bacterium]
MPIRVSCPECSQDYQLKDELAGKKVRCKMCQAIVPVPLPVKAKPTVEYDDVNFEDEDDDGDEFDFEEAQREERRSQRVKRPNRVKAKPLKKKKKRRRDDDLEPGDRWFYRAGKIATIAFAVNVVTALVLLVVRIDAVGFIGAITCIATLGLGAIYMSAGGLWSLSIALEEDPLCIILWFFVPGYGLYYIVTRWDQCARPVLIQLMGAGTVIGTTVTVGLVFNSIR